MDNENVLKVGLNVNQRDSFFERLLVNCAPTLMKVKPASLYCMKADPLKLECWNKIEKTFEKDYGVKTHLLKNDNKQIVILVYNEKWLKLLLEKPKNIEILKRFGYEDMSLEGAIKMLESNFMWSCPHELGIFLGYPVADVEAFIMSQSKCLLCGYWKVYSNPEGAKKRFNLFDKTKEVIQEALSEGMSPIDLRRYQLDLKKRMLAVG